MVIFIHLSQTFMKPWRYKEQLLDHEIYVKEIYFYYEVKGWAIQTHYPKLSFPYIKRSSRYMAKSLDHEIEVLWSTDAWKDGRTDGKTKTIYPSIYFVCLGGIITEPWNIGQSDPLLVWSQASSHIDSLAQGIMFMHQIVLKIYGKINEPWNIGHSHLLSFWSQASSHTNSLPRSIMFVYQIVFKV